MDPIHTLFLARCQDLGVAPTEDRKKRFVDIVLKRRDQEVLDLREQGIRNRSVDALKQILCTPTTRPSTQQLPPLVSRGPSERESPHRATTGPAPKKQAHDKPVVKFRSLILANNDLGDGGMTNFAHLLRKNQTLTELDLRSTSCGPEGFKAIFEALASSSCRMPLSSLDLSTTIGVNRNTLGATGGAALGSLLAKETCPITKLIAKEAGLGSHGSAAVSVGLAKNTSVTHLDLSCNGLEDTGGAALIGSLAQATNKVETLLLPKNHLGVASAQALGTLFVQHQVIRELDLSENQLANDVGMTSLVSGLRANPNITLIVLAIDSNALGDAGTEAISSWLAQSKYLQELYLGENGISSLGAQSLATAMRTNASLTKLGLRNNKLMASGVAAMTQAVTGREVLRWLDLSGNKIGNEGASQVESLIDQCSPSLQHLLIKDNKMGKDAGVKVAAAAWRNTSLLVLATDFNDFGYKEHTTICSALARNKKSWDTTEITRKHAAVAALRATEVQLKGAIEVIAGTEKLKEDRVRLGEEKKTLLEQVMVECRRQKEDMAKDLEKAREQKEKSAKSLAAIEALISRTKENREMQVMGINAKIRAEMEHCRRLQLLMDKTHKKLSELAVEPKGHSRVSMEVLLGGRTDDAGEAEEALRLAKLDRSEAQSVVISLRRQIEEFTKKDIPDSVATTPSPPPVLLTTPRGQLSTQLQGPTQTSGKGLDQQYNFPNQSTFPGA